MRYDLALFDFDGTLADSFPWFLSVMGDVADRFGFKRVDRAELETLRGYNVRQFLRHVGLPFWKLPLVASHIRELQAQHVDQIPLFPGVPELLRGLVERDVKIAIVSSNAESNVRAVLGPANAMLVSHYACSASVLGKPRKIRSVLRRTGVPASRAILIGDETRDIDAARACGVASGAVGWGYADAQTLRSREPTEVFERLEEIVNRIA